MDQADELKQNATINKMRREIRHQVDQVRDLIESSGSLVDSLQLEGQLEASFQRTVSDLVAGEFVYVRVVQRDGGTAWSSPIFIE